MATLAELLRFRDTLKAARYGGARRFRDQNGEEVEYRSDSELARALAALEAEISAASARPPTAYIIRTSKGL